MLLEALHIPLTTPFHPDGRLHPHKLAANVIRYSKSPAQGLIALSPAAGEPTLLTDDETREVLRTVSEAAAPEKVLLANISRDSVRATLALAESAAKLAFDAALIARPTIFTGAGPTETLTYFRTVADRSPIPIVLLSTPRLPLTPGELAELATHPNILGLLDATGSLNFTYVREATAKVRRDVTVTPTFTPVTARMLRRAQDSERTDSGTLVSAASLARNPAAAATAVAAPSASHALRTRTKTVGFQIIAGNPQHLLNSLADAATAIAPAFAACAPQACYEVYAAWKDADRPLALEKQERLRSAAEFAELLGPAGLKHGCDLNGYFGGLPRLPYLPLTCAQRSELQAKMASLRT